MTRPRAPRARYAIRRVRLIGFHNFVDETIEVRDAGHLFLLGDNGSGKTTVLDAIHLVLTGGLEVELNAAVRFGARREPGRSLAGVVLRHDAERGVVHRAGATAYAALELASKDDELAITLGVGLEATTMDAQVTKWGFVRRGAFDSLDLTVSLPEGRRAKTRDELRGVLGRTDVHLKMTDYRRAVADRLFGGEAAYEEVCRFWSMAKSYREIVSGARDFAGLFERLLPGPDRAVLGEIFDSLRRLEELDASVRALEEQRSYVAGVAELVRTIAGHREEIARYRWLGLAHRYRELTTRAATTREAIERASAGRDEAATAVETASARRADAERAVRAVEETDVSVAVAHLRTLERQHRELEASAAATERDEAVRRRRHADESQHHARAVDALFVCLASLAAAAETAIEDASRLPTLLPHAMEAAKADRLRASEGGVVLLPEIAESARSELAAATNAARLACGEAGASQVLAERELAQARAALAAWIARPSVEASSSVAVARQALALAGIRAVPLYELLEPRPAAAPGALATLEALLGVDVLGAIVTPADEVERARAILAEHRGARLAVETLPQLRPPEWIAALFAEPSSECEVRARAVLAAAVHQHGSFGELAREDALGAITLRGLTLFGGERAARLLGERARREAHAEMGRAASAAVSACEARARAMAESVRVAGDALARLERADASLGRLRSASVFDKHRELEGRARNLSHAQERVEEASGARLAADARLAESARVLAALRARASGEGIDAVELRLAELRGSVSEATIAAERATEQRVRCASELARLEHAARAMEEERQTIEAALEAAGEERRRAALRAGQAGADLAAELESSPGPTREPDEHVATDGHARAHVDRALATATKNEHARCEELQGDGSRGVRLLAHASRFAFTFEREALRVEDRRAVPVESVLAELDGAIGESREIVSQRTRELLDTLVMGALARELQGQVERLHETVLELNRLLSGLAFGSAQYRFRIVPRPERAELVTLVRRMTVLDPRSRAELRTYLDERRAELARGDDGGSELLDYRRWFDYRLVVKRTDLASSGDGETELTRDVRALGSGGEQGVPNYLLVLALAKLGYDASSARACPLLFDEAFYGIDAARRDTLLRFATDLGLQLVVASPDQDGVTPAVRSATTLFVVKDESGDVHLAPYHFTALERKNADGRSDDQLAIGLGP